MKQTLAMLFVTALLLFSLAGCGEKKDSKHANGPSTGTTDNGAADSGKKKDNMPGDDMSGENKKDDSVTGDGMMGDDMDGDGENTTRSVDRRNAAEVEDAGAVLVAELMEEVHQDAVQREPVLVAVPDDEAVGLEIIQPRHDAVADEIPRRAGHRRDKRRRKQPHLTAAVLQRQDHHARKRQPLR